MKPLIKLSIILIILTWYLGFIFGIMGWCEEDTISEVLPIIAQAESSGNPNAVGSAGEIGLYQISPILLSDYNNRLSRHRNSVKYEHLFNENVNEMICRWQINNIISALKKHNLPTDIAHICFGYNFGIGNMLKYPIPTWHKNLIYRKVFKEYYKNKEIKR